MTSNSESGGGGESPPRATAFIGDISASRDLEADERRAVQERLGDLLDRLNRELGEAVLAEFTITVGDEFQGLLVRPGTVPELMWRLRDRLPELRFWTGVGFGGLDTELEERAIGMDGPAFHRARQALEVAHEEGLHGGVFSGFGEDDRVLGGLSRLLDWQRQRLTDAQREAIRYVRGGATQTEAAGEIGVTRQAVSKRLAAAGWRAYRDGEESLRSLLSRYATAEEWSR